MTAISRSHSASFEVVENTSRTRLAGALASSLRSRASTVRFIPVHGLCGRARDTGMNEAICVPRLARTDQLINLPLALGRRITLDNEESRGPVRVLRFKLAQARLDRTHARAPWFPIGSPNFL